MKNILLACPSTQIDIPMRHSLNHLVSSCQIDIAHNGYQALEALTLKAFDLIIIDFTIPDIDSLELTESVQYIDPGVPVILMIPQAHQSISEAVLKLKAYPVIRPFKPLSFLRLIDQLLHQYLNRYRHLTQNLADHVDKLRLHLHAVAAFLCDDSGYVMTSSGTLPEASLETMAQWLVGWDQDSVNAQSNQKNTFTAPAAESAAGIYYTTFTGNLYLAVMVSLPAHSHQSANEIWSLLKQVARDIRKAFKLYVGVSTGMLDSGQLNIGYYFIPQSLTPPLWATPSTKVSGAEDEVALNWQIINRDSNVLSRLHKFCRLDEQ